MKIHGGKLKKPMYVKRTQPYQAKKALIKQVEKSVARKGENKFFDTVFTGPGGAGPPALTPTGDIALPLQGDGEENRDGRKINVNSIFIRGQVTWTVQAAEVNTSQHWRMMVVLDKQHNGLAATVISSTTGIYRTGSTLAQYQRTPANADRFQILGEIDVPLVNDNVVVGSVVTRLFTWSKKVNIDVEFDTAGTNRTNAIFLVDAHFPGSIGIVSGGIARIRFRDH